MRWRRSLSALAMAVAIAALVTLYYRATTLTNLIPVGYDTFTYFYPNEEFLAAALRQLHLPLWNPYLFAGVPFLANSQTAVLYPPNLLFVVTSIPRGYVWSVALHVAIAGLGMYAFARATLRVRWAGALAAAVIFAFGGFTGGMYGHLNQLQVVAWMPLALLLFERAYAQQNVRWALLAGIVVALQALAGHTQALYLSLVTLGLFFVMLMASDWLGARRMARAGGTQGSAQQSIRAKGAAEARSAEGDGAGRQKAEGGALVGLRESLGLGGGAEAGLASEGGARPGSTLAQRIGRQLVPARASASAQAEGAAAHADGLESLRAKVKAREAAARAVREAGQTVGDYARRLCIFVLVVAMGFALAAAQLVPTFELSNLSLRAGGLSFDDAASFSLPPWMVLKALLPTYGETAIFSEWLGYVGVAGLLLAGFALVRRARTRYVVFFALLAVLSLVLAFGEATPLYKAVYAFVPGIKLFRVPARWLYPYTLSLAALAGLGLDSLRALPRPGTGQASAPQTRADGRAITAPRSWVNHPKLGDMARLVGIGAAIAILVEAYQLLGLRPAMEIPTVTTQYGWIIAGALTLALLIVGFRARLRGLAQAAIVGVLLVELFVAGLGLELNRPNLAEAYSAVRPADSHIMADRGLYRTLAMTDNTFDPGDLAEMKAMLGPVLSEQQVYDYIVATKQKETLAPNLPMVYGIASLDGYDGGVLPLKRYAEFKTLFDLRGEKADAERFREQLTTVPSPDLLAWLNVKYVLMDRVHDIWVDGVYYDLGVTRRIGGGESVTLEPGATFATTSIGIVSCLEGAASVAQGTEVASVVVKDVDGTTTEFTLRAGGDTAEGEYGANAAHDQPSVVAHPNDAPSEALYLTKLRLPPLGFPASITVRSLLPTGEFRLQGLSLIDDRLRLDQSVTVDSRLRLAHLGDVKIYENVSVRPRAFLVNKVTLAPSDGEALEMMKDPSFSGNATAVVVASDWRAAYPSQPDGLVGNDGAGGWGLEIDRYEPERVEIRVSADQQSLLVLTDSHYPGWKAWVDGQEQPITRTNYLFRGVLTPPGEHAVVFTYEPRAFVIGLGVSAAAVVVGLALMGFSVVRRRRRASRDGSEDDW